MLVLTLDHCVTRQNFDRHWYWDIFIQISISNSDTENCFFETNIWNTHTNKLHGLRLRPKWRLLLFSFSFNVYSINWEFWISYQYQDSQKDWENSRDWDAALWSWWWPFDLWLSLGPNSDLHRRRWALVAHMTWGQQCLQSQGTGQATKTDEFSETFQMAFDPPPPP